MAKPPPTGSLPGWVGYGAALVSVALVTILIGRILASLPAANLSMLYLMAVLAVAIWFGSWPAVVASVAAFLAYDFFFVEPIHTFTVSDPQEWVTLLLFLVTAIVTGQLAASLRRRAQEAEQREREAVVLYEVVRLMGEPELEHALRAVAERLRQELHLAAVVVELSEDASPLGMRVVAGDPEVARRAATGQATVSQLLQEGPPPSGGQRGMPGRWVGVVPPLPQRARRSRDRRWVVPVKVGDHRVGSLILVRAPGAPGFTLAETRLLAAVAEQLGNALERARLRREATEAEVLRRTDELKTALLNAVSHDLRTPSPRLVLPLRACSNPMLRGRLRSGRPSPRISPTKPSAWATW
ncbi:MAG: DUF4118 domain-containing protein [Chloroflexi bacterium]|nr:DUF4118 domain-containing protein [Chloroflexota bacterium]